MLFIIAGLVWVLLLYLLIVWIVGFDCTDLIGVVEIVFSKGTLSFITMHTVVIIVNDISPRDPNTRPNNISAVIIKSERNKTQAIRQLVVQKIKCK